MIKMVNRIYIETLGCPKNRVDTEVMTGILLKEGFIPVSSPKLADFILLNSCAFIESARAETIARFFHLNSIKQHHTKMILTGCLVQREPSIAAYLPEAAIITGIDEIPSIAEKIRTHTVPSGDRPSFPNPHFLYTSNTPRVLTQYPGFAYLKIADGCENNCTYCTIPSIRGAYRERSEMDILREAENLIKRGVRELIITAQDSTQYNRRGRGLSGLIEKINTRIHKMNLKKNNPCLVRIMYLHPRGIDDALLHTISESGNILPYFEIPLQHTDDTILAAMNRGCTLGQACATFEKIRKLFGQKAVIRTTFITGFPEETPRQFRKMFNFIETNPYLDYIGLFPYSRERDTPAADMKQINKNTIHSRYQALYTAAGKAMKKNLSRFLHTAQDVLIDDASCRENGNKKNCVKGRAYFQAPEIDGTTYVTITDLKKKKIIAGNRVSCRIKKLHNLNFYAEII